MNEQQIREFINKCDELKLRGGANVRIFAQRARLVVNAAYSTFDSSFGKVLPDATQEQIAIADKLIAMGTTEALYGRGRSLLMK